MSEELRACEWVRDHIDAYVDGADAELSADDRRHVVRHTAACTACADELAWATRVRAGLRDLAVPSAPRTVIERAEREIAPRRDNVVRLRPRTGMVGWVTVAAALVLLAAVVWIEGGRRRAAEELAVEQATHEAAVAFAYLNKYARRAGDIVEQEVIEERLMVPVERAMKKSGVTETKPDPGQS